MIENNPEIEIKFTLADHLLELLGWFTLLFLWVLTLYKFNTLPQIIPVHFNLAGKPDGFGSKSALFLLPIFGTVLFIALTALNKVPHVFNYPTPITPENALKQYTIATRTLRFVKLVLLIVFTEIVLTTIATATQKSNPYAGWFLPVELLLILVPALLFYYKSGRLN